MKILYGLGNEHVDITTKCYQDLMTDNIIRIPPTERSRFLLFGDPAYGKLKEIIIVDDKHAISSYDHTKTVFVDTIHNKIYENNAIPEHIQYIFSDVDKKLEIIHSKIKLKYGEMKDELPEQRIALRYLTGNERVLELGSNVGRNSMIIAFILKQKNNNKFVTLECDPESARMLEENMKANGFNFHIVSAALSKRRLIQKGWNTIESDVDVEGFKRVETVTLKDINQKYRINFDTLIVDCEGAFYYILKDMPEILNNVSLIIMENDYYNPEHKKYVDDILKKNKFMVAYHEPLTTHEGLFPHCRDQFYQVWKRPKIIKGMNIFSPFN